ncbi:hypothetical protein G7047_11845 [Diaphorobacter sp. HDW4A]|uniref:hypothetical protein n=1 Tax=Diaphorobacter sp. HDW4A TaxID=2714924 RepID=UPI0014075375|nr:hypothetical protein [Diaphorobacter sp. HDW4A]QIL78474.1 hypothetical protein G7047_11845 [Diaphorobacter sp. HDW4A]
MADKAKDLGFSAEELKKVTTPTKDVHFQNVPDPKNPGKILSGPHAGGKKLAAGVSERASKAGHQILFDNLKGASTKRGALARIRNFADKYTSGGRNSIGGC